MNSEQLRPIFQRASDGDAAARGELVLWAQGAAKKFASRGLGPRGKRNRVIGSSSVAQSAIAIILQKPTLFFEHENPRALIGLIVRQRIADRRRKKQGQTQSLGGRDEDSEGILEPSHSESPLRVSLGRERSREIAEAFERLSEEQRWIIASRRMEKRSFKDIGEELGCRESACQKRYAAAIEELTRQLPERESDR